MAAQPDQPDVQRDEQPDCLPGMSRLCRHQQLQDRLEAALMLPFVIQPRGGQLLPILCRHTDSQFRQIIPIGATLDVPSPHVEIPGVRQQRRDGDVGLGAVQGELHPFFQRRDLGSGMPMDVGVEPVRDFLLPDKRVVLVLGERDLFGGSRNAKVVELVEAAQADQIAGYAEIHIDVEAERNVCRPVSLGDEPRTELAAGQGRFAALAGSAGGFANGVRPTHLASGEIADGVEKVLLHVPGEPEDFDVAASREDQALQIVAVDAAQVGIDERITPYVQDGVREGGIRPCPNEPARGGGLVAGEEDVRIAQSGRIKLVHAGYLASV